ncbi:MAG: CBU_0592 family membrane protein [Chloroflexota bacterium]
MDQIFQVAGALLILGAYIASLFRMLDPSSWAYLLLNLVGSAVLALLAWLGADWGFLLLEGVWAVVTAGSIIAKLGGRDAAPSPHG